MLHCIKNSFIFIKIINKIITNNNLFPEVINKTFNCKINF